MKVLSLYWGLCATAALYVDGKLKAATHEERFTRNKNDEAFPSQAIQFCLDSEGLTAEDLDGVAIASNIQGFDYTAVRHSNWSVDDYLREQHEYWRPKLYQNEEPKMLEVFQDRIDLEGLGDRAYWESRLDDEDANQKFCSDREQIVANALPGLKSEVKRIEHHRAHAAYSYYASPFRGEKILSLTIDGWGDGRNATIGVFDENGSYQVHYSTDQCSIGRIYRYMTLVLGMKPNEHEFKVMGLAPYGKEKYAQKALDLFMSTLYVDGLDFKWNVTPEDSYYWFKERLEGVRFDNVAYALQTWVENLLITWVENAVKQFGISKVVISGGVAMNIKAMGKIASLDCIDDLFIGGSASDESLAIGSAICMAEDLQKAAGDGWSSKDVSSLPHLYLGPDSSMEDEDEVIAQIAEDPAYQVIKNPSNDDVAQQLATGKVIARCAGRMEFGQRALGNRSIMADPSDLRVKDKINAMIKSRDFWMPFAPIVLDKFVDRYLVNPKNIQSPHMTIGFDTTEEGFSAMIAACHPADKTARAQILKRETNEAVYGLIEAFEKITGRGSILNTSFNLHGYPIVNTPHDAFDVFIRSGLDGLLLNSHLIMKRE